MEEELSSFNVVPINESVSQNKPIIKQESSNLNTNIEQIKVDSMNDTFDSESVQPLYGGSKKNIKNINKYQIICKNKVFYLQSNKINEALNFVKNELHLKNDALLEVKLLNIKKNKNNIYHYLKNKKKFIKIR
jgi:hypothetical protein